jgi:hypothetical protein
MKTWIKISLLFLFIFAFASCEEDKKGDVIEVFFVVTDTGQSTFFDDDGNTIYAPKRNEEYYGQDAQFFGIQPLFIDNGDGTISDKRTGLMWQKTPTFKRYLHNEAITYARDAVIGEYNDWRVPTIKELYSLVWYKGEVNYTTPANSTPYIQTDFFDYKYDSKPLNGQYWSSTPYLVGTIQGDNRPGAYCVDFAQGYMMVTPTGNGSTIYADTDGCFVRLVRGQKSIYGTNVFTDNSDGTITDSATGLMWQKSDDGNTYNWKEALSVAKNSSYAGYKDWRIPNIKELQSIVDYSKTTTPMIDNGYFKLSDPDCWIWTCTTHNDIPNSANYISFGKSYSKASSSDTKYIDWYGAGAQVSDIKSGDPNTNKLSGSRHNDMVRVKNHILLVRSIK